MTMTLESDPKNFAHVTAGRDPKGLEWTLCGLLATWEAEDTRVAAAAGRFCIRCQELDA